MNYLNFFLVTLFLSNSCLAQRKTSDFIEACGPATVGKYLPLDEKEMQLFIHVDSIQSIHFQQDDFCNNGKPKSLLQWLNENPLTQIEISGHTHAQSNESTLSTKKWCEKLKAILINKGIESSRIITEGKGKSEPIVSSSTIAAAKSTQERLDLQKKNRRIEIKIIADQYKRYFSIADMVFYKGQILDNYLSDQLNRHYDELFEQKNNSLVNNSNYQDSAIRVLNVVSIFLQTHPTIKIEVGVFSDSRGDAKTNQLITLSRAKSVMNFLVEKGANKSQIIPIGYGESRLLICDAEINKMTSEEEKEKAHAHNRRIEIRIY